MYRGLSASHDFSWFGARWFGGLAFLSQIYPVKVAPLRKPTKKKRVERRLVKRKPKHIQEVVALRLFKRKPWLTGDVLRGLAQNSEHLQRFMPPVSSPASDLAKPEFRTLQSLDFSQLFGVGSLLWSTKSMVICADQPAQEVSLKQGQFEVGNLRVLKHYLRVFFVERPFTS